MVNVYNICVRCEVEIDAKLVYRSFRWVCPPLPPSPFLGQCNRNQSCFHSGTNQDATSLFSTPYPCLSKYRKCGLCCLRKLLVLPCGKALFRGRVLYTISTSFLRKHSLDLLWKRDRCFFFLGHQR